MRKRQGPPRRRACFNLREDLLEVLAEVSDDVVIGRNLIVEAALERYFATLELPVRTEELPPDETNVTGP